MLIIIACAGYAYHVNVRRPDDDPKKGNFPFGAVLLAPFTWPFLLIAFISLFLMRALLYGFFLIFFTISLIIIPRESSEPSSLEKMVASVGETLLEANMLLVKLFLKPWADEPNTT